LKRAIAPALSRPAAWTPIAAIKKSESRLRAT